MNTDDLAKQLKVAGTPERMIGAKAYLKSDFEFFGVSNPDGRRITRQWARQNSINDRESVLAAAEELWASAIYEMKWASVDLFAYRIRLLDVVDLGACESRIRTSYTWALVDPLSGSIAGQLGLRFPAQSQSGHVFDRWSTDEDFWVRRSAMLAQLPLVRSPEGNASRFLGYADAMLTEKEFFIRKAIGWVLREISRKRPDLVFEWLLPRAADASGVTYREAIKYLSQTQRAMLARAR